MNYTKSLWGITNKVHEQNVKYHVRAFRPPAIAMLPLTSLKSKCFLCLRLPSMQYTHIIHKNHPPPLTHTHTYTQTSSPQSLVLALLGNLSHHFLGGGGGGGGLKQACCLLSMFCMLQVPIPRKILRTLMSNFYPQ